MRGRHVLKLDVIIYIPGVKSIKESTKGVNGIKYSRKVFGYLNMTGLISLKFTQVYKALAHPMRLEILAVLLNKALNVNDLSRQLNKRQSNISQHLQVLRKNNLVSSKRVGKKRIYKLDTKNSGLVSYLSEYKV